MTAMRTVFRFFLAHVLASYLLQLILIAQAVLAGERFNHIRAAIAEVFAPILIPLPILHIGPKMRPMGYVIYCLMYLALLGLAFFLLTLRARRKLRRRRIKNGQCTHCGYDLRGSRQRCAECGLVPQQASVATSV